MAYGCLFNNNICMFKNGDAFSTYVTLSCSSRTILEKYLKHAVTLAEDQMATDKKSMARQSQTHFHLAHYADALFRNCEERLNSSEWQAAMRLRKHKVLYPL